MKKTIAIWIFVGAFVGTIIYMRLGSREAPPPAHIHSEPTNVIPNQPLVPANELERALLAAKKGEIDFDMAWQIFLNSEIVVLQKELDPENPSKLVQPLVLGGRQGERVVALFSSSERAQPTKQRRPEFRHEITRRARDILIDIDPGHGIVVNSGWEVGLQLPPPRFEILMKEHRPSLY